MHDKIYPDHIYDAQRRKIASQLVHKELIKLFPSLNQSQWKNLLPDINGWFDGEASQLAPVHDFWNGCDGILAGFKLKSLVTYFTAENVAWKLVEVPTRELSIHWRLPSLKDLGDPPYSYDAVQEYISDPAIRREQERVAKLVSSGNSERDEFPVIVLKEAQKTTMLDGNRRLMQSFLDGKPTILTWVGEMQGESPSNYWVSTAYLRSILRTAEAADLKKDEQTIHACRQILLSLFRESDIAQTNWRLRCENHGEFAKKLLAN